MEGEAVGLRGWIRCWILPVCLHADNRLNVSVKSARRVWSNRTHPRAKQRWPFLSRGGCDQADADIELPGVCSLTHPHKPPWQSVKRGRWDYSAGASNPALPPTVNNPHIEILSTPSFVSSISILLWCASWMPRYASRTAQSGSPLKETMHPILMRRLSYWNCTGTFVTRAFQFAFHNKWVSVDKKKN